MKPCTIDNCRADAPPGDRLCPRHRERSTALSRSLLDLHVTRATYRYPFEAAAPAPTVSATGVLSFLSTVTYVCAGLILAAFLILLIAPDRAGGERAGRVHEVRP